MNNSALQREEILFRPPVIGDGTAIYELIRQSPPLDLNSRYLYLLLCDHFSESCIIAESESRTVGFISAYGHPKKQETLFVWQVAVARDMRGRGLAGAMLDRLLFSNGARGTAFIETTVTPSNGSSLRFFHAFAENRNASCVRQSYMTTGLFGDELHEEEMLLRIGPLRRGQR